MKRKIIAVVLSISLAVSFSACGNNSKSEATKEAESTDVAELQKQVEELQKENEKVKEQLADVKENTDSEDTGLLDSVLPDDSKEQEQETWPDDTVIAFTDEKMANDVRELIGVPEGNITYGMVKDIKEFQLDNYTDITPIKYFTSLTILDCINSPQFTDISSVENLQNLKELTLHCEATDISPIGNLKNLEKLDLHCKATDITPIEYLQNLDTLVLECNTTDISPIGDLQNLEGLNLHCEATDISPISNLQNLERLNLSCKATDISPISNLQNLEDLNIHDESLTDISGIEKLNNLITLDLYISNVENLTPLKNLNNLEELHVTWKNGEYNSFDLHHVEGSKKQKIRNWIDSNFKMPYDPDDPDSVLYNVNSLYFFGGEMNAPGCYHAIVKSEDDAADFYSEDSYHRYDEDEYDVGSIDPNRFHTLKNGTEVSVLGKNEDETRLYIRDDFLGHGWMKASDLVRKE